MVFRGICCYGLGLMGRDALWLRVSVSFYRESNMLNREYTNDGAGLISLMIAIFAGLFVLLFKAAFKTCDVSGQVTKWGVAQFKNRRR